MKTDPDVVAIAIDVLDMFRAGHFKEQGNLIPQPSYHGFMKWRLSEDFFEAVRTRHDFESANDVQIELVRVQGDLRSQTHRHKKSTALVIILGMKEFTPSPKGGMSYEEVWNKWIPIEEGGTIAIPPNTVHGFTVEDGGDLWFLSVQSPSIQDEDGHDDYHVVPVTAE